MSAMRIGVLLVSFAAFDLAQPAAPAPDSSGWITGVVTDLKSGNTLIGARVGLGRDGTERQSVASVRGSYLIGPVQPGIHAVTATIVGYRDSRNESLQVSAGCTTRLDIRVRRLGPSEPSLDEESLKRYVSQLKCTRLRGGYAARPRDNRVIEKAWRVWLSGRGSYAVMYEITSVEGEAFTNWLLIKDGTCRLVRGHDFRGVMDSRPRISQREVTALSLVYEPDHVNGAVWRSRSPKAKLRLIYDFAREWRDRPLFFP